MRYITMHPNVQSKSSDTGNDLYPIYSPTSPSSSPRSLYQRHTLSRRRKVASESNDLFKYSLRHPSPDSVNARMFAMPEEGTSSADEDPELLHSTRSMGPGYHLLSAKDRLRSVSLEWTMSNGSVTPRAPHYHTHPPLDFKSLKQKLEQLTGSRDDVTKKHFLSVSGHEKRKGVVTTLPATTTAAVNPAGVYPTIDAVKKTDNKELETTKPVGTNFFPNVPYVTIEPVSRRTSEEIDSKAIAREFGMKSINQTSNKGDSESSDKLQWSDLAQSVAQQDGKLQMILKRHCQEFEDLKKKHDVQWEELHKKISESVTKDLQQNEVKLQSEQRYTTEGGKDQLSLLSSGVDLMPGSPGVLDDKQTTGHSLDIRYVVPQSVSSPVDGKNTWKDTARCADGIIYPSGANGITQQLPVQVRSQLATPSMSMFQRQLENQASHQMEQYIRRELVERTLNQWKIPPVLQQVEPLKWYQQLEMIQRLQAAGSLEQRMRQLILQQVSQPEAPTQSAIIRCHRFPNHLQCQCARPCDLSQSFLPYIQEHSYSPEPYSAFNLNGRSGLSYTPNYAQVLPFPQASAIQQSPCNEVSSYYCPENLAFSSKRQALCCSPDQVACLLEAARNNLLPTSPGIMTPPPTPMPLLSHLVARQSPLSPHGSYPSSLRPSPLGLPLLPALPVFQFPPTYAMAPDILQLLFPMNPFAT